MTTTTSRRTILAGAAALPALAAPAALAYNNPDANLIALCERLRVLLAEREAIYAEQSEVYDRATAAFTPPPEISLDVLKTSPLFEGSYYRDVDFGGSYIPSHVIAAALKSNYPSRITELVEGEGTFSLVVHDKLNPPTAEMLARREQLHHMLEVAEQADNDRDAVFEKAGYVDDKDHPRLNVVQDEINELVSQITKTEAASLAGMMAKFSIWDTDPEFYNDYNVDDDMSIAESLVRDVPAVFARMRGA